MSDTVQLAGASVAGRHHQLAGRNNQDAFAWERGREGLAAVVCDGCGSARHSEVGAQLCARLLARELAAGVDRGGDPADDGFWRAALDEVLAVLGRLARALGDVGEQLLCTAVGAVVTREAARAFSIGDGLIVWNGNPTVLGPFAGNAPPYLGYALLGGPPALVLHPPQAASELRSIALGTDGAAALLDLAAARFPGSDELVGPIESNWTDDRIFTNPDHLRRRLRRLARDVGREPGLLADDATLVVIRRAP